MKIVSTPSLPSDSQAIIYLFEQNDTLSSQLSIFRNVAFLQEDFKADFKQIALSYDEGKRIYLIGVGKNPTSSTYQQALRSFFYRNKSTLPTHISIANLPSQFVEAAINGILLASYQLGMYKSDEAKEDIFSKDSLLNIIAPSDEATKTNVAIEAGIATAETQMSILDLMNAPANKKTPQKLAEWAIQSAQKYNYAVEVFDEKQCAEKGFHALLAVGQGSRNPPRLIVMEYKGKEATKKIGLVGKGVTFDTGGISIKPSTNMHLMKSDMGGAGAVLGTIELAAKLQLPIHLVGIIPTTENSVDGNATKPGDVIDSYAGKTIEVIDTDAEGRLILADGLSYMARQYAPAYIIDLATLTGSCVATLGYTAAGLFTNNEELAQQLYEAGQQTGEKVWRLPLWDDYKDELKSDIADLKNYHGKPIAGAIVAAKFLEVFVENHAAWAHLDIAGTAFADSEFATMKSATAYGIKLLTEWMKTIAKN